MRALEPRSFKTVPGKFYGSPKEVWGFRSEAGRGPPRKIAADFLRANAGLLRLEGIAGQLRVRRVIESLGAWHVIAQQEHLGMRIHRAYVTVHLGRDRRVYLAKNRAIPRDMLPEKAGFRVDKASARRRALRAVEAGKADVRELSAERVWFPEKAGLRPAWKLRLHREAPRQEWLVYVDGIDGKVISKYDNLAEAAGTVQVFDPNPVVALGDWRTLVANGRVRRPPPAAYVQRPLDGFSASGLLDGPRVTTKPTASRIRRPDGKFVLTASQHGFEEVMVYFHVDRAIRYLETLGYRGARSIFPKPIAADARGTRDDNSWYSPGLRQLTFGTGGVDDAEDAETILHELGHAIQDAICPDFGQSEQAAAMGEGFGDYFAASFFAAVKPAAFRPAVMSWDAVAGGGDPPALRRLDGQVTFEGFEAGGDEHVNGLIWSAALWDVWRAVGRGVADRIVIESHFQLDGFATMARGARAILDADRNLFAGKHLARLRKVFQARGIGPV